MEAYRIAFTLPEEMRSERLPLADWNPAAGWRLPVPATFLVDQQGTIRTRYVNINYRRRMEPAGDRAGAPADPGRVVTEARNAKH